MDSSKQEFLFENTVKEEITVKEEVEDLYESSLDSCIVKEENEPGTSDEYSEEPMPSDAEIFAKYYKDVRKRTYMQMQGDQPFFDAVVVPAMQGKHDVLYYRTYCEQDLCWSFQWKRNMRNGYMAYVCNSCKLKGVCVKIDVLENQFIGDPAALPHICEPVFWPAEAAKRKFFETTRKLRDSYSTEKPSVMFKRMIREIQEDTSLPEDEKKAMLKAIGPFEKHRRALSRAANLPSRLQAISKKENEKKAFEAEQEGALHAVDLLLNTVKKTRQSLAAPPAKRVKLEDHDY